MAGVTDVRVGISSEVKKNLIPAIDHSHFLGYDIEDRIVLYTMAVSLATKYKMPPTPGTFSGLVMMKSVPDEELAELLLMYLANAGMERLEERIDDIGLSRRKETVANLNQLANSGFSLLAEKMKQPEDIVIAEMIDELDEAYAKLQESCPELGLPAFHAFSE